MTEISLRYQLTEDEVVNAIRTRISHSWSTRVLVGAAVIFAFGTSVPGLQDGDWSFALSAILPFFLIVGLYIVLFYGPIARRRLRKEPRFFIEQTWRFTEDGVEQCTEHGELRNAWSAYSKAGETAQFFFLFLSQNMVAPIPKRTFANVEEQVRFRELLKRKRKLKSM